MGPAWGEVRVYTGPSVGCPLPAGCRWGQRRCPQGPNPGLPATFCPLSPSQGRARDQATFWLGRWGREVEGPVSRSQVTARCLSWAGARVHCARTEEQRGRRPKPAGLYTPPCCGRPSPRSAPMLSSSQSPNPQICTPRRTQESHQLLPLCRGPAAPRASLDGSRAAASSSSSSSSSSPSVNSSWLRP